MKGRTTLVIAHCLSTVQNADKTVVMDHGKVLEQGSHTELITHGGAGNAPSQTQFQEN